MALTGVVVNDSLVMLDFVNRSYRGGDTLDHAIREAGKEDAVRPPLGGEDDRDHRRGGGDGGGGSGTGPEGDYVTEGGTA